MPGSGTEDFNPTEVADVTPLNNGIFVTRATATGAEADLVVAALALRGSVSIQVDSAETASIFIGPTGVTTANGWEIKPGGSYDLDAGPGILLRVITDGTDVDYQVLEAA